MNRNVIAVLLATSLVVIVAILGFHALGSPGKQRLMRGDHKTLENISNLAQLLNLRHGQNRSLPDDLTTFPKNLTDDPVTHRQIAYRRISDTQFQLCAVFNLESQTIRGANQNDPNAFWSHPKGYYCYQLDTTQPLPPFYNFGSGPFN